MAKNTAETHVSKTILRQQTTNKTSYCYWNPNKNEMHNFIYNDHCTSYLQ